MFIAGEDFGETYRARVTTLEALECYIVLNIPLACELRYGKTYNLSRLSLCVNFTAQSIDHSRRHVDGPCLQRLTNQRPARIRSKKSLSSFLLFDINVSFNH